ncbi:MAG TPA: hypothetical protein VI564_04640 [Candidatus Nanoarchaeia archaeon]|nr:hypothetical protein [Candidatus Nanoarchaeia archaeon]
MGSKSQISVEFLMLIGLAAIIAIAFQYVSLSQIIDFKSINEKEAVKDVAIKIQREILLATSVEDGYVRTFEIPDKLGDANYTITLQNSTLTVQSKEGLYFVRVPKISGNLSKGYNTINKTGGVINVN